MKRRMFLSLCVLALPLIAVRADDKPKKLLLITDSGGFVHDSVGLAEKILKETGPSHGYDVTCFRFTRDPNAMATFPKKDAKGAVIKVDGKEIKVERNVFEEYAEQFRLKTGIAVEKENCGRVNKETLSKFDIVLFFTTGNPTTPEETKDLVEWVKAGHAYAGTHCASDTLYKEPDYGELVGGYFDKHPWGSGTKLKVVVEDPKSPIGAPFVSNTAIQDEIYQFMAPYSRDKLHIILKVDNSSVDMKLKDIKREDKDFAISWIHEVGKGRSFYTSLGHRKEMWMDERYQKHLYAGLDWATGKIQTDSTPSGKK